MHTHWKLFREKVTTCDNPDTEMEIELAILIDDNFLTQNEMALFNLSRNQTLYNSFTDQHFVLVFGDGNILVDRCVPRSDEYVFSVTDLEGNGFGNGKVEIYN